MQASPPARGSINEDHSSSSHVQDELQLADLIHGCLRVLINLTNRQATGCSAILAAVCPIADSALFFPSFKHSSSTLWGFTSIFRVITSFASSMSTTTSLDDLIERSNFDSLVLALGLLANCVEYEPSARESLLHISINDEVSSLSSVTRRVQTNEGRAPAIHYLCSLFFTHYKRLGLRSESMLSSSSVSLNKSQEESFTDETNNSTLNPDDVVVSSYLSLLLGCSMRENKNAQSAVFSALGPLLSSISISNQTHQTNLTIKHTDKPNVVLTIEALSLSLKAFIALQTATGTLTEETIHHVQSVQCEVFDVILSQCEDKKEVTDTLVKPEELVDFVDSTETTKKSTNQKRKGFSWANLCLE